MNQIFSKKQRSQCLPICSAYCIIIKNETHPFQYTAVTRSIIVCNIVLAKPQQMRTYNSLVFIHRNYSDRINIVWLIF